MKDANMIQMILLSLLTPAKTEELGLLLETQVPFIFNNYYKKEFVNINFVVTTELDALEKSIEETLTNIANTCNYNPTLLNDGKGDLTIQMRDLVYWKKSIQNTQQDINEILTALSKTSNSVQSKHKDIIIQISSLYITQKQENIKLCEETINLNTATLKFKENNSSCDTLPIGLPPKTEDIFLILEDAFEALSEDLKHLGEVLYEFYESLQLTSNNYFSDHVRAQFYNEIDKPINEKTLSLIKSNKIDTTATFTFEYSSEENSEIFYELIPISYEGLSLNMNFVTNKKGLIKSKNSIYEFDTYTSEIECMKALNSKKIKQIIEICEFYANTKSKK